MMNAILVQGWCKRKGEGGGGGLLFKKLASESEGLGKIMNISRFTRAYKSNVLIADQKGDIIVSY